MEYILQRPKNILPEALYMSYVSSWKTIGPKKNQRTQGKEHKHKKSLLKPLGGHKLGDLRLCFD